MSTTPTPKDETRPGTTPDPESPVTPDTTADQDTSAHPGSATDKPADPRPDEAQPGQKQPDEAPTTTPGRGAHLQARPTPVPPEPSPEDDYPHVSAAGDPVRPDTAPTTTLPPLDAPLHAPLDDLPPVPPAEPGPRESAAVRRTSFRSDYDSPLTAPTGYGTTPPPAVPYPDLPGTGPSDDQVPLGDATAEVPEHTVLVPPGQATEQPPVERPVAESVPVEAPRRGGVGRLLLGLLVGLVVGAVGVWLVLFGQSRILGVQAPGWDASYDPLGVVLVTLGVLVLAALIAAGLWSAAAPVTAGLLSTVIGVVYLYVPATTHADTVSWLATDGTRGSVERTVVVATSGTLFVVGALLLATGIVCAVLHRHRFARAVPNRT
ncbi:hypothetical protein [Cellulomonas taurus]|uniref:hypothetical protein n=1 Tax=Cellulomonas taurus TaxID=2729175 RepID=UPI00145DCC4C|nr:hypothetical protein [Cellulomonas taurus]